MSVAYCNSPTPHHLLSPFNSFNSSPSLLSSQLSTPPVPDTNDSQGISFTSDTVHSTWSEFTKKKNSRAELTRLENISWRIWHAFRLTSHLRLPQPRFAVKVDAATSCLVDPQTPSMLSSGVSVNKKHKPIMKPLFHQQTSTNNKSTNPINIRTPSVVHSPFRTRKQSLQVDPRRLNATVTPQLSTSTPSTKCVIPKHSSSSIAYTSRPFVVIELPSSIYDCKVRHHGLPVMKRVQRHADLAQYFHATPSSVRMLTGAAARAAIMSSSKSISSPTAVVFFMGSGSGEDSESDSDESFAFHQQDLFGSSSSSKSRTSLDECRPTFLH